MIRSIPVGRLEKFESVLRRTLREIAFDGNRVRHGLGLLAVLLLPLTGNAANAFAAIVPKVNVSPQRTILGEPGKAYWQQHLVWTIDTTLDVNQSQLFATATLKYHNKSPHVLSTLWLDNPAAAYRQGSRATDWRQSSQPSHEQSAQLDAVSPVTSAGIRALSVRDHTGKLLLSAVSAERVAVPLKSPLLPGQSIKLTLQWTFDFMSRQHPSRPRFGVEQWSATRRSFAAGEWIPRVVAFTDYQGFALTPFLGNAEFNNELADYRITIYAPQQYWILASGDPVSTALSACRQTPDILYQPSDTPSDKLKKWTFVAHDVRDFAWVASNALHVKHSCIQTGKQRVDIYTQEKNDDELWSRYAHQAIQHGVENLQNYFGEFPFSTVSVSNVAGISMEYPGLSLVGFRQQHFGGTAEQPAYSRTEKYDVIGGILHEVAHSYFPLGVNTDEAQEGFVDEGLTSWLSFFLEQSWGRHFQSFYGEADWLAEIQVDAIPSPQMSSDHHERKLDAHYHLPAAAYNFLRETVLGRAEFDRILRELFRTWRHKRMTFDDMQRFFNTRAGEDLSWFWSTWFYDVKPLRLTLHSVKKTSATFASKSEYNPLPEGPFYTIETVTQRRDMSRPTREERQPDLVDQYSIDPQYVPASVAAGIASTTNTQDTLLRIEIENANGQPTPLPLLLVYRNGARELRTWSVDIWRHDAHRVVLFVPLPIAAVIDAVEIDPHHQLPLVQRQAAAIKPME